MIQFDKSQQLRAIELIESMSWGDMENAIRGIDDALLLAYRQLQATSRTGSSTMTIWAFATSTRSLPTRWQLCRTNGSWPIARLLRSLALSLGVGTEFGDNVLVAEHDPCSPAGLLRGLNDISCMPLIDTKS